MRRGCWRTPEFVRHIVVAVAKCFSGRGSTKVPRKSPQSQDAVQETRYDDVDDLSFLRLPEVKAITRLSKTSLYAMIRNKTLPAPVRLGPRAVAWVRSEVRHWAMERVHASRSAA